ncbi:MAG: hypothetical protein K0U41_09125 [Gammaproteobacteria bacterium]|nr:hypothetical protein [Gammaproteobacteria bacterium]
MKGQQLTKLIIEHIVAHHDGWAANINVASKKGVPDILACIDGEFFAFEVKSKNDKEKPLQTEQLLAITLAKGCSGYVRSLEDVDHIIANRIRFVQINPVKRLKL